MHCFTPEYQLLPCGDHIESYSSSDQHSKDLDKKMDFASLLTKSQMELSQGKHSLSEDPSSIQELLSPDSIKEPFNQFLYKGKELMQTLEKDSKNLEAVSRFVQSNKDTIIQWENSNYFLRLCDLNGTIYMGQTFMQEGWEQLYLPKPTRMQVFGTLENIDVMLPSVQCIILVGEDGCIYAYREEELQLMAKSLREFVKTGISDKYPTIYMESDSSDEEDEPLQQDEEILKIRQRTKEFVNKSANEFDDFLSFLSS